MKVDSFDSTLILENDDLQTILNYFKDDRIVPDYIERLILKEILDNLSLPHINLKTTEQCLKVLPDDFVKNTIQDINHLFNENKELSYTQSHLSYLLYYLPGNLFKIWKPLLDIQIKGALKEQVRILDIGTGPGSVPIGIIEYYKTLAESFPELAFSLSFVLIENEIEFLNIAFSLIEKLKQFLPTNLTVTIETAIRNKVEVDSNFNTLGEFDLITLSNFFTYNENNNRNRENSVTLINELRQNTRLDGSLIIIEPGDRDSCLALKAIRNKVVGNKIFNLFSPCVGIWEEKRTYECACFNMVRCYWQLPKIYNFLLRKGLKKAQREKVPFNYLVLRKDTLKKYDVVRNSQHYTRVCELKDKIGQTANVVARIRTVIEKGNNLAISLCDGSCAFTTDESKAIWLNITKEELEHKGINVPMISGEKITLRKVSVLQDYRKTINLVIRSESRILIDY